MLLIIMGFFHYHRARFVPVFLASIAFQSKCCFAQPRNSSSPPSTSTLANNNSNDYRIEQGGIIPTFPFLPSSQEESPQQIQQQQIQQNRRWPPNTNDPDYFHGTGMGGPPQEAGQDGALIIIAQLQQNHHHNQQPQLLHANYFFKDNVEQDYIVPGNRNASPYEQVVLVKVWGGGGGGCNGGRGEIKEALLPELETNVTENNNGLIHFSAGAGGGYVEAKFRLPVGETLKITIGGGGKSEGSRSDSLGGLGGYNWGQHGRADGTSGGGGGGGMTTISLNGTVIAAAYGGVGGGNTTYCSAHGGLGAILLGHPRDTGGYVDTDLALVVQVEHDFTCPGMPMVTALSHDAASFTWNAGSNHLLTSKETYVHKYVVHLANGAGNADNGDIIISCEQDFELHHHIQRSIDINENATTTVEGLEAHTPYCISIEAFSKEGLSLGKQILPFITAPAPINEWLPITIRENVPNSISEEKVNEDISWCEHSSTRPTGRRGHSMTTINNEVYIFGGATLKCICEFSPHHGEKRCSSKNVFSDELWHFDPMTSQFSLLDTASKNEPTPRAREQHSATTLANGNIIVIAGVTSSNYNLLIGEDSILLADVWKLSNPHQISSHVISGLESDEALPMELTPGHVSQHRIHVSLNDDEDLSDKNMCIEDIQVKISIDHDCPSAIEYISLTGPGVGDLASSHGAPQSREYKTKVKSN